MFQTLNLPLRLADCFHELATTYHCLKQYDEAEKWAKNAIQSYQHLGDFDEANAIRIFAKILISKGEHDQALKHLMIALERSIEYGTQLKIAQALIEMGRIWMKKEDTENAQSAFNESKRYYKYLDTSIGNDGIIECNFYLNKLDNPALVPTEEEKQCLYTWNHEEDINI